MGTTLRRYYPYYFALSLTGCTIHVIDDTADYDIRGSMESEDCKVVVERTEGKTSGKKQVDVK